MGVCGSSSFHLPHIMLVGLENAGKTFFLYSRLKTIITPGNDSVRTKPTDSFNYEEVEIGAFNVAVWDLPGRTNLRIFWPNFYRTIEFSGLIYFIDYDNKDVLPESVRVMHDLLSEEELEDVKILIILNKSRVAKKKTFKTNNLIDDDGKDGKESKGSKEKETSGKDEEENEMNKIREEIKKTIYFDLIKQKAKDIYYFDLYESTTNENDMQKTQTQMKKFISSFD